MMNAVTQTALVLFLALPAFALDFPEPRGYVNDFAGVIDATTKINLEAELQSFTQTTSHEIAVVTIKTLDGDILLKIPEGINNGEMLRVKGKGVPTTHGKGDTIIRIHVTMPSKLSRKAKESIEKLKEDGI